MKTYKVIALCAAVLLVACSNSNSSSNNNSGPVGQVLFDPLAITGAGQAVIPYPFDGLFAGFSSPTLNIPLPDPTTPSAPANAIVNNLNQIDGFSTTASLFADVSSQLNYATVPANVVIIDSSTGKRLIPGTDFVVQNSLATTSIAGTQAPIAFTRSRILILLKHPLKPATTYLAAITNGIKTVDGAGVAPSDEFLIAASATPVDQQTGTFVNALTPQQKATLETLRSQLIYPAVQGLGKAGVPASSLLLAWTFTTESIGDTLNLIAKNPPTSAVGIQVADTGQNTASPGLPGLGDAEVYAGITQVPYYLNVPTGPNDPAVLTGFWHANPTQPTNAVFAPTQNAPAAQQIPCKAFAAGTTLPDGQTLKPSASTTACFPALDQSTNKPQTIPVLVTVPNASSGQTEPANGWPVVIFQHGITRNRLDMFGVADGLAKAGFVVVAIDLPLHGITDNTNPFFDNQLFKGTAASALQTTTERTFNLDLQNNSTSAPGPDGTIDPSGTYFINLTSPITSRDNNRQAVSDLLTLANTLKTSGSITVAGVGALKIDPTKIRYFGHSLGAIIGSTLMGVDPGAGNGGSIGAAVLANPGGGEAKLLDASGAFGPIIAAGLAANGVQQGSDDYETFLRFTQQLIDPADPINYARLASANHKLDMIEVIGDAVVPNSAPSTCPANLSLSRLSSITSPQKLVALCPSVPLIENGVQATDPTTGALIFQQNVTIEPGYLAGTDPLWMEMGLTPLGPITPSASAVSPASVLASSPYAGGNYVVQFKAVGARHGSVLDPSTNPYVTTEMQCEAATFLASDGALLPVGCSVTP